MNRTHLLLGAVGTALALAGAVALLSPQEPKAPRTASDDLQFVSDPTLFVDDRLNKPLDIDRNVGFVPIEVPDFILMGTHGKEITKNDLKGTHSLIYFGFVNCPDVCINSTDSLTVVYDSLTEEERQKVRFYYFSFDTGRDTPERIADYLSAFNESFIGVSGHGDYKQQMGRLMHAFDIIADRKQSRGTYAFSHSNHTYMLDENGDYLTHYNYQTVTEHPEKMVEDLRHVWAKKAQENL